MRSLTRKTFKKKIVTEEALESINPDNKKLRDRFLKEKDVRSSSKTIDGYRSDLNIFFVWNFLYNDNKIFTSIRKLEFADFFAYVTSELQWGSARFSRLRACLSSFSQFIEKFYDEEYPTFRNVILRAVESMPKSATREKTVLTEQQVDSLFEYLKSKDIQKACWLSLAISSGARFSELFRFTVDIIDFNNLAFDGIFLETLKPIKTKGRTKSGKMIRKYIIKDVFEPYYKEWMIKRKEIMEENGQEHNFLFIKKDGSPAEDGTIRSWINDMSKFLSVPFYPHALRHYITTRLSKLNIPHQLIKEIMGWESVVMVEVYDDTTAKDKKWTELENLKNNMG